jgi:hypothetical protein
MAIPTGLRGTNGQPAAPPYSNGPYTLDQDLTLSGTNTLSGATTLSGGTTISGDNTMSGHFQSQIMVFNSFNNPASDWAITANGARLVLNKEAKSIYIPLSGIKVGDEIAGFRVLGGGSGSATTEKTSVASFLCRNPKTAGSAVFDSTVLATSTIVDFTITAGTTLDNGSALTTVHTVIADNTYYIAVSATTPNKDYCGLNITGVEVDVNRK